MALIVEDGTIVENAVTYASPTDLNAYATARGLSIPADNDSRERLLIKAMDFLELQESRFQGSRVSGDQALAWPRYGVTLNGFTVADDSIPTTLKNALCQLAVDANSLDLMPNGTGRSIIRQKVDVIETEYEPTGSGSVQPELNKAMAFLSPLFSDGDSSFTVPILRV